MTKWFIKDVEIDNRDPDTTELVLPTGDRLEVTRDELMMLLENMDENNPEI